MFVPPRAILGARAEGQRAAPGPGAAVGGGGGVEFGTGAGAGGGAVSTAPDGAVPDGAPAAPGRVAPTVSDGGMPVYDPGIIEKPGP